MKEVLDGSYEEEPEIERLTEMRTLIDRLKIKVNLMGHHISNTVPITEHCPMTRSHRGNIFNLDLFPLYETDYKYKEGIRACIY